MPLGVNDQAKYKVLKQVQKLEELEVWLAVGEIKGCLYQNGAEPLNSN